VVAAIISGCGSSSQQTVASSNEVAVKQVSAAKPAATQTPAAKPVPHRAKVYPFKVIAANDPTHLNVVKVTAANITDQAVGPMWVQFNGGPQSGPQEGVAAASIATSDHQKVDPSSKTIRVDVLGPGEKYTVTVAYSSTVRACVVAKAQLVNQTDLTPFESTSSCGYSG
jgi:hypothetical protein